MCIGHYTIFQSKKVDTDIVTVFNRQGKDFNHHFRVKRFEKLVGENVRDIPGLSW